MQKDPKGTGACSNLPPAGWCIKPNTDRIDGQGVAPARTGHHVPAVQLASQMNDKGVAQSIGTE